MAYTPVPPHFCKTAQWNAFASNQEGCDAMLVLFYKFSHAFLTTQRMAGYVATFGNLSYASSTSGVTFVSVRAMDQTPILINEVVRRIIQVLFTLSIVWPRLLEPRKVLRGSLNVDRRRNG
jgi:hypothetical protein